MGIRFACHECGYQLHVKDFQAGRRGKCPKCQVRFRIPTADAPKSFPVSDNQPEDEDSARELQSKPTTKPGLKLPSNPSEVQTLSQDPAGESDSVGSSLGPTTVQSATEVASDQPSVGDLPQPSQPASSRSPESSPQTELASVLMQSSVWYLRDAKGNQLGPADSSQMQVWLLEGKANLDSFVWCDAWPDWKAANEIFPDYCASASVPPPPPAAAVPPLSTSSLAPSSLSPASAASSAPVTSTSAALPDSQPASHTSSARTLAGAGVSAAQQAQIDRRLKKKRRYQFMMITLSIVAVLLLVVLGLVLALQE
ncbi:MAG TPA: hypothetical protein DDW52_29015 [Planctomycetaceae bacterium]|nr:hypothetical protein [Planctomycetaceae bacterium]